MQIHYCKIGPARIGARISLVDESGYRSSYKLYHDHSGRKIAGYDTGQLGKFTKMAAIYFPTILNADKINDTIGLAGLFLVAGMSWAAVEIGHLGRGVVARAQIPKDFVLHKEIPITKKQYSEIREELNSKTLFYSFSFNNCVQLARRTAHKVECEMGLA